MFDGGSGRFSRFGLGVLSLAAVACGVIAVSLGARPIQLLGNTVLLAGATAAVAAPLGAILAWLLLRCRWPAKTWAFIGLMTILFVPTHVHAAGWRLALQMLAGATSGMALGMTAEWRWLAAWWIHVVAALPWAVLISALGIGLVDPDLEAAALVDRPVWSVILSITFPLARPLLAASAVWVFASTAAEITVTDLYQVRTYAEEVYTVIPLLDWSTPGEGRRALGLLVAGCGATAVMMMATFWAAYRVAGPQPVSIRTSHDALVRFRRPSVLLAGWFLLFAVMIALPVGHLLVRAGFVVESVDGTWTRSWSLWKSLKMTASAPWYFAAEYGWSLTIGLLAATTSLAISSWMTWMARRSRWWAVAALLITGLTLATPGPLIALATIHLLNGTGTAVGAWLYDQTVFAPVLVQAVRVLPMTILLVWYVFGSLSQEILDAAAVDGARGLMLWARVVFPLRWRALVSVWIMATVVAMGELAATILVVPPGITTLPVRIFGLLHAGVDDQVAGLCLSVCGGVAMLAGLIVMISQWTRRPS